MGVVEVDVRAPRSGVCLAHTGDATLVTQPDPSLTQLRPEAGSGNLIYISEV